MIWHLMPHYLIAAAYMCLLTMRVPALYACRFGEEFPGMRWPGDEDELNAAQMWLSPVLLGASMPFLLVKAYQERRITYVDLDPNEDQLVDLHEALLFSYKNLGTILNVAASVFMCAQLILWGHTPDLSHPSIPFIGDSHGTVVNGTSAASPQSAPFQNLSAPEVRGGIDVGHTATPAAAAAAEQGDAAVLNESSVLRLWEQEMSMMACVCFMLWMKALHLLIIFRYIPLHYDMIRLHYV